MNNFINKIMCGDCLENLKKVPDESVHLIVSSPPYNLNIDYGNYKDDRSYKKYLD